MQPFNHLCWFSWWQRILGQLLTFCLLLVGTAPEAADLVTTKATTSPLNTTVDLGRRLVDESLSHTYALRNTTNKDIVILNVKKSCGCEKTDVQAGTRILVGESLPMAFEITSRSPGLRSGRLTLLTDSDDAEFRKVDFTLNAEVIPRLEIIPQRVYFTNEGEVRQIEIRENDPGLLKRFSHVTASSESLELTSISRQATSLSFQVIWRSPGGSPHRRRESILIHFDDGLTSRIELPVEFLLRKTRDLQTVAYIQEDASKQSSGDRQASNREFDTTGLPSSDESQAILNDVQKLMTPPIRYRLTKGGAQDAEHRLALKPQSDGSYAMRLEIVMPITNQTTLVLRDKVYQYFAAENMAMDRQFRQERAHDEAKRLAELISNTLSDSALSTATCKQGVLINETGYWEIWTQISEERLQSVEQIDNAKLRETVPVRRRFLIHKASHLPREMEEYSISGNSLKLYEFQEVESNPDLPDELFQLPEAVDVTVVTTLDEDVAFHTAVLAKNRPERVTSIEKLRPERSTFGGDRQVLEVKLDQDRAEHVADLHRRFEEKKALKLAERRVLQDQPTSPPENGLLRWGLIIVNTLVLGTLVVVAWLRRAR